MGESLCKRAVSVHFWEDCKLCPNEEIEIEGRLSFEQGHIFIKEE